MPLKWVTDHETLTPALDDVVLVTPHERCHRPH